MPNQIDLYGLMTEALRAEQDQEAYARRHWKDGQWYFGVSAIGKCPRSAYWGVQPEIAPKREPFNEYSLHAMRGGIAWEEDSYYLWTRQLGVDRAQSHAPVHYGAWIGEIDFLIDDSIIIEHKNASIWSFKSNDALPRKHHVLQATLYGWLWMNQRGHFAWPEIYLYYRARNDYMQVKVFEPRSELIGWRGIKNGDPIEGSVRVNFTKERERIEQYHPINNEGEQEIPPMTEAPFDEASNYQCFRMSKHRYYPTCPYFAECWPELSKLDQEYFTNTNLRKLGIEV